jgi:hypothetical protein
MSRRRVVVVQPINIAFASFAQLTVLVASTTCDPQ